MQASFKVQFNGKYRRFSLEEITFEGLVNEISKKFGLDRSVFLVSYVDEEGDRINLSSSFELNEAMQYALPAKCLKLLVYVPTASTPIVQEVKEVLTQEPQVLQEDATESVTPSEPIPDALEILAEKKLRRKQRVPKVRKARAPKREKALRVEDSRKSEKIAKPPRSIKNKKTRVPRPFMARVIAHVNYPTGQEIAPNVDFVKVWKLRNTGTLPWTSEFKVVRVSKNENALSSASDSVALDREVAPGNEYEVNIPLRASNQPGTYESAWRLVNTEGKRFGQRFSCKVIVVENKPTIASEEVAKVDKKARSVERKYQRAEKLAKYGAQLAHINSLGMKTTARHVRLLEKFDGNVDQVIAFISTKKNAARLA